MSTKIKWSNTDLNKMAKLENGDELSMSLEKKNKVIGVSFD